ncbi:hypothetical protein GCM10009117_08290 [Gangjinia marincola]|uniref:Methyltransferase domain-containing protein n=1 Tax=Gangjinia marincola TaxID=578463 RepID=A0ABP3XTK6_9FLAO
MMLTTRSTQRELMDDLSLEKDHLRNVLNDISTANKLLNGDQATLQAVLKYIDENPKPSYRFMDVGCGNGDMLIKLHSALEEREINAEYIGIDLNPTSIEIAREETLLYPKINFLQQDIFTLDAKRFECDVLLCTLTLHHFASHEIPRFLETFRVLATDLVIVNDLQRNKVAYQLFKLFSAVFMKTKIAKQDGLTSIASGFTETELHELAEKANIPTSQYSIESKWAFRYLWSINAHR